MESKAFEEFIQNRCAEIISENEAIQAKNNEIVETEACLKETFSKPQLSIFLRYEKLCSDHQLLIEKTVYKECLNDWQK